MSSIFRVKIEVRMSGDPPPGFTLVTSKKRSLKAVKSPAMSATVMAAMLAVMSAAELTAKSAAVRGTAEGQSPEKGKGEVIGPGSVSGRGIKT